MRNRPSNQGRRSAATAVPDTVVYGRHPVQEALRGRRSVHRIFATPQAASLFVGRQVMPATAEELHALCGSSDHQGVVAQVDPYPYVETKQLLQGVETLIICLDGITDPQNLGAVARVADAAGAAGIVVPRHDSVRITPAACKAAAGALEHVPVAICRNLADFLKQAKGDGRTWVFGASQHGQTTYDAADFSGRVVLVLGSEGAGIRPRVAQECDLLVTIPLEGKVESLNVATACAVIGFEVARQRRVAAV